MEVDLRRWRNLADEITALRATSRGFNDLVFEITGRLQRAQAEADRLEDQYRTKSGQFPAESVDAARQRVAEANTDHDAMLAKAGRDGVVRRRGDVAALRREASAAGWLLAVSEAREAAAGLLAEYRRIEVRQAEVHRRFSQLRAIEQACIAWSRKAGISLPGDDDSGPPRVTLPAPVTGREFGAPGAGPMPAAPAARGADASTGRSGRSLFSMFGAGR